MAYPPNKFKNSLKNASILHLFYEILLGYEQLPFYYKMLYITNNNRINLKNVTCNIFEKQEIWYPNINKTWNRHGKEFIMKIVTAIDSFKGSMTSMEAGQAAAEGIQRVDVDAEVIVRPLADGGEGTVEALVSGMNGTLQKYR